MKIFFKYLALLSLLFLLTTNCSKSSDSDEVMKSDVNGGSNSGDLVKPPTDETQTTPPSQDQTDTNTERTRYGQLPVFKNHVICIGLFCSMGTKKMGPKFISANNDSKIYFFPDSGQLEKSEANGLPNFSFFRTKKSADKFYALISGIFVHDISLSTKLDLQQERARGKELHVLSPLKSYFSLAKDDFLIPGYTQIYSGSSLPTLSGRAEDSVGFQIELTEGGSDYLYNFLTRKNSGSLQFEYCAKFLGLSPILPGYAKANLQEIYEQLKTKFYRGPYLATVIRRYELIDFIKSLISNKQMDYQMSFFDEDYDFFISYFINDLVVKGLIGETNMKYENPLNPDYFINLSFQGNSRGISEETKYTFSDHKSMSVSICKIFSLFDILKKYPELYKEI
ncbi:MAG: hypothetical protein QE271_06950 [Bacteriovoracaceae bacterium]|nr:hypothetical protein [Bacteriovoracaceae bacterium]